MTDLLWAFSLGVFVGIGIALVTVVRIVRRLDRALFQGR